MMSKNQRGTTEKNLPGICEEKGLSHYMQKPINDPPEVWKDMITHMEILSMIEGAYFGKG